MSPVQYLLVSMCFTSGVLAVIFWIAWRSYERHAHALTWSITFAVVTIQRIVNLAGARFPDRASYWVAVNALGLAALTLALVGHRQRAERRPLWGRLALAAMAVELAIAWFTYGHPHVGLQMAIQPIYGGLVIGWVAIILYRHRTRPTPAEVGAAGAHFVFGLSQLAAGVVALGQGATGKSRYLDLYLQINYLVMPAAFVAMGLFVVFILASDMAERMRQLAVTDPLTGLLNRRGFREAAERAIAQALRAGQPVSVVLADIDRFKSINDTYGHAVGDAGIRALADHMRRGRRAADLVARIGGEEFVALLPNTGADEALSLADRIRCELRSAGLAPSQRRIDLTASFGVATVDHGTTRLDDLLTAADKALYRAKEGGRDRVELAPASPLLAPLPA
jgi:diguanylate cyclase (GGDEF)-like protein